jgi:hypothetical protein
LAIPFETPRRVAERICLTDVDQKQLGQPYRALLVSDGAVRTTQGSRSVLVLSGDDQIESRAVNVGPLQDDGLRVIAQGLKPDDLVVIGSAVPPQTKARPKLVPMPTSQRQQSPSR